jgi:histidinol-phosphate aminotransferase
MIPAFNELPVCLKVYPTGANFFLAKVTDADAIYHYLVDRGVIVRNRNRVEMCQGCLRITIGTPQENNELLSALRQYK